VQKTPIAVKVTSARKRSVRKKSLAQTRTKAVVAWTNTANQMNAVLPISAKPRDVPRTKIVKTLTNPNAWAVPVKPKTPAAPKTIAKIPKNPIVIRELVKSFQLEKTANLAVAQGSVTKDSSATARLDKNIAANLVTLLKPSAFQAPHVLISRKKKVFAFLETTGTRMANNVIASLVRKISFVSNGQEAPLFVLAPAVQAKTIVQETKFATTLVIFTLV